MCVGEEVIRGFMLHAVQKYISGDARVIESHEVLAPKTEKITACSIYHDEFTKTNVSTLHTNIQMIDYT